MPNRIILLNNKPVIARYVGEKNVYGHYGSFWIKRTASAISSSYYLNQYTININKPLPGVTGVIGAIQVGNKIIKPYARYGYTEGKKEDMLKTRYTTSIECYTSDRGIPTSYSDTLVMFRLDEVVRLYDIVINPYSDNAFTTYYDKNFLLGSKGMWCNGEIIMFKSVEKNGDSLNVGYINVEVSDSSLPEYRKIKESLPSDGASIKCFIILDEERV